MSDTVLLYLHKPLKSADGGEYDSILCNVVADNFSPLRRIAGQTFLCCNTDLTVNGVASGLSFTININNIAAAIYEFTDGSLDTIPSIYTQMPGFIDAR
jgi:hypothetical protein